MGVQNQRPTEGMALRELRLWRAQKSTRTLRHTEHNLLAKKHTDNDEEDSGPMVLSNTTRKWFTKNGLEGFLRITDAPPHEEPEQVAPTIDLEEITKGTI